MALNLKYIKDTGREFFVFISALSLENLFTNLFIKFLRKLTSHGEFITRKQNKNAKKSLIIHHERHRLTSLYAYKTSFRSKRYIGRIMNIKKNVYGPPAAFRISLLSIEVIYGVRGLLTRQFA